MRAAVLSAVSASVSFFAPGADLPVQPAFLQPAFQLPDAPRVVVIPSARSAGSVDESTRWFCYGVFAAVCAVAARSQLSVATLATAGSSTTSVVEDLRRIREALDVSNADLAEDGAELVEVAQAKPATRKPNPRVAGFIWDGTSPRELAAKAKAGEAAASSREAPDGVVVPAAAQDEKPTKKPTREAWKEGIFAPAVLGAKNVMGEQKLKEVRAAVITKHSKVIADFVDTSESKFGQLVLKRMFEYADKDGNGTLDREELRSALYDLGFDFLDEKKVDQIMKNADKDKNDVIDFEEFVKATPKSLRTNLVKLAKQNGHDLGFLV
jgi:hypothetical protein